MHSNKNSRLDNSATQAISKIALVNHRQPFLYQCSQEIPQQVIEQVAKLESVLHVDAGWNEHSIKQTVNDDYTHMIYMLAHKNINGVKEDSSTESIDENMTVIAYCIYQVIFETAEIYRIGTNPNYQQQGHANLLIRSLFDILKNKQCERLLLEVRADNMPAINLYSKHDFKKISLRKGYYQSNGVDSPATDALILQKSLL